MTNVRTVKPAFLAACLICTAASTAVAPIAAADPVFPTAGSESASATIADLKAQGFDVVINWLTGYPNVPLSECSVNGIHNPDGVVPNPSKLSTVYVDVACPNAK
jgi:hypothetical protein